jgi:hypothetical protein
VRWAEYIACRLGKKLYKVFAGKLQDKRPVGRLNIGEDIILQEVLKINNSLLSFDRTQSA